MGRFYAVLVAAACLAVRALAQDETPPTGDDPVPAPYPDLTAEEIAALQAELDAALAIEGVRWPWRTGRGEQPGF